MRVDMMAGENHFVDHLAPIWNAMQEVERGIFWATNGEVVRRAAAHGISATPVHRQDHAAPVVVASYGDVKRARTYRNRGIALLQHGAGQSYGNQHPSYSGGGDHDDVGLFLCPNTTSADRWRAAYPEADVQVVGSPKVETLPARVPGPDPTIAFSFHWQCNQFPECRPAFTHHRVGIEAVAQKYKVIGHAHPRAARWLEPFYKRMGIPFVADFADVCKQADVYVCDNSSTIFEFAATGRPVVLMNAPWYRRSARFGLRFWDMATVGQQVDHPSSMVEAVTCALVDPPGLRQERERIVPQVYGIVHGASQAAVTALRGWQG